MPSRFFLFMFVVCPLAGFLFIVYPIRTSRMWIFLLCIMSTVYGMCLTLHMCYFWMSDHRPQYAVLWEGEATKMPGRGESGGPSSCMCGCPFPLSDDTVIRLIGIGLLAAIKSFVMAFRCLKGLRRSNWANLMSVTFPVPVSAYSVEWATADGKPIKGRMEGQPVQSELAFDPFALMDEQPDSGNTHLTLKPSPVMTWEVDAESGQRSLRQLSKRNLLGPCTREVLDERCTREVLEDLDSRAVGSVEVVPAEYIGCCGFPCRTGGVQGRFSFPAQRCKALGQVSEPASAAGSRSLRSRSEELVEVPSRNVVGSIEDQKEVDEDAHRVQWQCEAAAAADAEGGPSKRLAAPGGLPRLRLGMTSGCKVLRSDE